MTDREHELSLRFAGKPLAVQVVGTVDGKQTHSRFFRLATGSPELRHGRQAIQAVQSTEPHDEADIPPNRKARLSPGTPGIGSGGEL